MRWVAALDLLAAALLAFWLLPVVAFDAPTSTVLVDRDGQLLGATIAADEQWRFPATGEVPARYRIAVTAFEDRRFDRHPGVDPLAVGRAVVTSLRAGEVVSGASTLTMQTVRLARANPPRTVPEKLWEMLLALRLEASTDKSTILRSYASHAPFGGNTVGVEAAAWRYMGRPADELSWAEAATLAVLPNAPGLMHPGRRRGDLKAKRDRLLDTLVELGHLSADDRDLAVLEPLPGAPRPVPRLAPHRLAASNGHTPSTLRADLQRQATEVVWRHHAALGAARIHNLAALIVDVPSGEVLAWVGNVPDLAEAPHHNHVDVVTAPRSTGSTLKPLLYVAMLTDGQLLPRQVVPDVPMRLGGFAPQNFDRRFEGAVRADEALARSRNVPAIWLLRRYGIHPFYGLLQRQGMSTLHSPADHYGLSLALGGAEGTLFELVDLYRRLAWAATDPDGPPGRQHWRTDQAGPDPHPPFEPASAWLTARALLEVQRPGVHGAWRQFGSGRRVAWKTGTSWGFRDGWAIGFTPRYAVGVWVGNASGEGRPELTGVAAAAPVLFDLVDLVDDVAWFDPPADLVDVEVCAHSGQLAGPSCTHTVTERVPPAGAHSEPCDHCQRVHLTQTGQRAHAGCADLTQLTPTSWFSLPADQEAFYAPRHPSYEPLPDWAPACEPPDGDRAPLALLSPKSGSVVAVPVELDGRRGRLVMEAAHRDGDADVHWHLDGRYLTTTRRRHQVEVAPGQGAHEVVVVDEGGHTVVRHFEVKVGAR
jgi:penicillin-binding protein 1C